MGMLPHVPHLPQLTYFYSQQFILFYILVWSLHWLLPSKLRNPLLLLASFLYYSSWNPAFLFLLLASSGLHYWGAIMVERRRKAVFFLIPFLFDISALSFFKYGVLIFPNGLGSVLGTNADLKIILPLGISFYTFQTLGYAVDVFRGRIRAEKNPINFFLFVSFFPQLIAGPIERAAELLPQIKREKNFREIEWREAIYLFTYGYFKKRVLGDYFSIFVAEAFSSQMSHGYGAALGIVLYSLQAFADISGYTDMARGLGLGLGIRLQTNFRFPFFAKDPSDFWQRWHISLTSWFRHYVYVPLLTRTRRTLLSISTVFFCVSLWYGPHLHYLIWGGYWFLCYVIVAFARKNISSPFKKRAYQFAVRTFTLISIFISMSLFRAENLTNWLRTLSGAFNGFHLAAVLDPYYWKLYFCIALLLGFEFCLYRKDQELWIPKSNFYWQATFYIAILFLIRNLGTAAALDFIYFGF